MDIEEGILGQQQSEGAVKIENAESSDLRLSGRDIESINEKPLRDDEVEERVDVGGVAAVDRSASGLAAAETGFNATIIGSMDIEAVLAGENLASSVIADDVIDVGDGLAVLATGGATERRSNSATTTYGPTLSITLRAAEKKNKDSQLSASPLISTQS